MLALDLLPKLSKALCSTSTELIKIILWGLSNLATNDKMTRRLFENEECLNRILLLMRNNGNLDLKTEAGFVMTNALTSCSN